MPSNAAHHTPSSEGNDCREAFAKAVAKARHDLRNPLAHILGFTEILIEQTGPQGLNFLNSRLQLIERTANELTQAVNGELEPQRIESGESDIAGLLTQLQKTAGRIRQTAASLQKKPAVRNDVGFLDDLTRIAGAASQLVEMAEPTLAFLLPPHRNASDIRDEPSR